MEIFLLFVAGFLSLAFWGWLNDRDEKKQIRDAVKDALAEDKKSVPRVPHPNYDYRHLSSEELIDIVEKRKSTASARDRTSGAKQE